VSKNNWYIVGPAVKIFIFGGNVRVIKPDLLLLVTLGVCACRLVMVDFVVLRQVC
jgi:hypothetical protein